MADWPVIGGGSFAKALNSDTATSMTSDDVTCAANNTKGAWVELISATVEDYCGINIVFGHDTSHTNVNVLMDIGVGASGSEQVILANIGMSINYPSGFSIFVPLHIPSGTRISARGQTSAGTSMDMNIGITGVPGDFLFQSFSRAATYGAVLASTEGTKLPSDSSTSHVKGVWTEITSATEFDIQYLIIDILWPIITTSASSGALIDIAVGTSGNEQAIISNLFVMTHAAEIVYPQAFCLPVKIKGGSRISGRLQQARLSGDHTAEVILHGLS